MKDKRLIERNILQSRNPESQIIVEADLRLLSPYDIKNLMLELGHKQFENLNFTYHSVGFWEVESNPRSIDDNLERKIFDLYKAEKTDQEIAKITKVSLAAIKKIRKKHGLEDWKSIKLKERLDKIIYYHKQGLNDVEIAKNMGVGKQIVVSGRNKLGLISNVTQGRPKKDFEQEEKARKLYDKGYNDSQIARKLNVPLATVYRWRTKERLPSNFGKKPRKNAAQLAL